MAIFLVHYVVLASAIIIRVFQVHLKQKKIVFFLVVVLFINQTRRRQATYLLSLSYHFTSKK